MGSALKIVNPPEYALMADSKKDAEHIRAIMRERGMTQQQFADAIGLTQAEVSRKLAGKSAWSDKQWILAAKVLHVTPRELHAPVTTDEKLVGRITPVGWDRETYKRLEDAARQYGLRSDTGSPDLISMIKIFVEDGLRRHEAKFRLGKDTTSGIDEE
jgi:transcriptional regulator with XRE-family HTH domain